MQILWVKRNFLNGIEYSWEGDHGFPPAGCGWFRIVTSENYEEAMRALDAFMAEERDA